MMARHWKDSRLLELSKLKAPIDPEAVQNKIERYIKYVLGTNNKEAVIEKVMNKADSRAVSNNAAFYCIASRYTTTHSYAYLYIYIHIYVHVHVHVHIII